MAAPGLAGDDLFALVRRAYCYADVSRSDFDAVIDMLSEASHQAAGAEHFSIATACMASSCADGGAACRDYVWWRHSRQRAVPRACRAR
jgi:hypothetical protein